MLRRPLAKVPRMFVLAFDIWWKFRLMKLRSLDWFVWFWSGVGRLEFEFSKFLVTIDLLIQSSVMEYCCVRDSDLGRGMYSSDFTK